MLAALPLLVAAAQAAPAPSGGMRLEQASFSTVTVTTLSSPSFRMVGEAAPPVAMLVLTPRLGPGGDAPRALPSAPELAALDGVPEPLPAHAPAEVASARAASPPLLPLPRPHWRPG